MTAHLAVRGAGDGGANEQGGVNGDHLSRSNQSCLHFYDGKTFRW